MRVEDDLAPERLARSVREEVLARDAGVCRLCGTAVEYPALHHIRYRSQGGLDVVENLVSLHWMYAPRCHEVAHSNKNVWAPLLLAAAATPGVSALQLRRWANAR